MSGMIRTMARAIAKENMRRKGYTKADRGKQSWSEFFSKNWRRFVRSKRRKRGKA
jgi:hypothetical protein